MELKVKTGLGFQGKYRFIKTNSITGEKISESPWIKNLIMLADTKGLNLILRRMGADFTYDCVITSGEIGTGNTAPTDSDANLQTPILTGINIALQSIAASTLTLTFYIPSANLANGTYKEFGLRCAAQMFSRSIITPDYVKGTNEDTTIEYIITASNT